MLLIYTNKITPRINYIFRHFFVRILNIPIKFSTKVEEFVAHNGPKMTYGKIPLGNEFFIKSNELLFNQGIDDFEISLGKWDDVPTFFSIRDESSIIPFDVFAASFYLISRYEEYLPHVKDLHERFPFNESIAYKFGFLEKPIIDIWAYKLLELLKVRFPNYEFGKREFQLISTIDVDMAFAYKNKGVVRTIGGFIADLANFRLVNLWHRFLTILNFKEDPFDTFNEIIEIQSKYGVKTLFFFLIGDYTTFDKNISSANTKFKSLIKSVADYSKVGLHPSYFSSKNMDKLSKEKSRLATIINTPIKYSRQHFLRLNIPETYQNLIDLDIEEDYTMGYSNAVGFRASTCTPFYFYDLDFEIQTPLKIYPFAVMDVSLKEHMGLTNEECMNKILALKKEVQDVNGTFISLFHNETLSENEYWTGWKTIYKKMVI